MLHLFAHSLRTVLTVKCMTRSHENDVRPGKCCKVMKLSLAVFRLHIASHLKKNKVLARHKGGGEGGIKCALVVCFIDVSMYLF